MPPRPENLPSTTEPGPAAKAAAAAGSVPSVPQNFITYPGNSVVTMTWTAPAFVGSPPLDSSYYVYIYTYPELAFVEYTACAGCNFYQRSGDPNPSLT